MAHVEALEEVISRKEIVDFGTDEDQLVLLPAKASAAVQTLAGRMTESGNIWRWPAEHSDFIGCIPNSELVSQGLQLGLPALFQDEQEDLPAGASLTDEQLDDIYNRASFKVPSVVEGAPPHEWTLSGVLSRGLEPARQQWCDSLTACYETLAFNCPELVVGGSNGTSISIRDGFHELYGAIQDMCRGTCGGRTWTFADPQAAIEQELARQQVEGLRPLPQAQHPGGAHAARSQRFPRQWVLQRDGEADEPVDFTLLAPEVERLVRPRLEVLQVEVRRQHRQRTAAISQVQPEYAAPSSSKSSLTRLEDDDVERWLQLQLEVMAKLTAEFPALAPQLVAVSVLAACRDSLRKQEIERRKQLLEEAKACAMPWGSSGKWCSRFVEENLAVWREGVEKTAGNVPFEHVPIKLALAHLRTRASVSPGMNLRWWIRLLEVEFRFRCSDEPGTIAAAAEAARTLIVRERHYIRIWSPSNWRITWDEGPDRVRRCSVNKYLEIDVEAEYFWRFDSMLTFTWSSAWNGCFYAIVAAVWGPTGVKALFNSTAFHPDTKVDPKTGALETDYSYQVETLYSRLQNLWANIDKRRLDFENSQDNGILSKSIQRPFHCIWVYGIVGGTGSVAVVLGQTVLTAFTLTASGLTLTSFMLWAPSVAVLRWSGAIVLYDPHEYGCLPLPRAMLRATSGLGRITLASLGLVLLPPLATLRLSAATLGFAARRVYDEVMFAGVIKPCARVPKSNSFLARRTAGPGISATCYWQLSPGVALAALRAELELQELTLIENTLLQATERPIKSFQDEVQRFLRPLLLDGRLDHPVLRSLSRDREQQRKGILEATGARRKELQSLWTYMFGKRGRLRLSMLDLQLTLEMAAQFTQEFATERLLHRYSNQEKQKFWDRWDLVEDDWMGLGRKLLARVFSEEFVEHSLEELDEKGFSLKVTHPGIDNLIRDVYKCDVDSTLEPLSRVRPCEPALVSQDAAKPAVANLADLLVEKPCTPTAALRPLWYHQGQAHDLRGVFRGATVYLTPPSSDQEF